MNPVEPEHLIKMEAMGQLLKKEFEGFGFCLLVFDFGEGGNMNYMSNANREDMVTAMKECIAALEGRLLERPKSTQ